LGRSKYSYRSERQDCSPVVIGDNCRIGARVQIDAGTVIGDNVTIGADANQASSDHLEWSDTIEEAS